MLSMLGSVKTERQHFMFLIGPSHVGQAGSHSSQARMTGVN